MHALNIAQKCEQFPAADLVTFTEEIRNANFIFCAVKIEQPAEFHAVHASQSLQLHVYHCYSSMFFLLILHG